MKVKMNGITAKGFARDVKVWLYVEVGKDLDFVITSDPTMVSATKHKKYGYKGTHIGKLFIGVWRGSKDIRSGGFKL